MSLRQLSQSSLQFILFGGKGGVGKTTMAAATAVEMAREHKVLLFTTDPAPSLADSFGQKIGSEPTAVEQVPNLFAMEIDASKVLKEFKEEYGSEILDILQQGTYLADEEAEELFQMEIPGLDEVMSFKKIMDFMDNSEYDMYIVDTAPTGHTLRLLMLPDLLDNWIKFLGTLRWKYHTVVRHLAQKGNMEGADKFLVEMKKTVKKVHALLQDVERTEFVVVTIAEKMAVAETQDLIKSLHKMQVPSGHIIINNIFPQDESDFIRKRRGFQDQYIQSMKEMFPHHIITEVVLQATEVQGIAGLQTLGTQLFTETAEKEG
ncbi:ArsA family ATPase [Dictyobacter aurantiacus]|uniref:Arsenic transporter ATPase n=1 Tax=Dictyobacter aurantiacus TaxID=1936993 RepID=A0A401ZGR6_9CHLR|nr:ArsA family ATPase [Dictyobacter aurantiacus]GCE06057.1 arsenic transporter ATPase [Dictyobacter aurantiacus]